MLNSLLRIKITHFTTINPGDTLKVCAHASILHKL
jgi:hypothetical protein